MLFRVAKIEMALTLGSAAFGWSDWCQMLRYNCRGVKRKHKRRQLQTQPQTNRKETSMKNPILLWVLGDPFWHFQFYPRLICSFVPWTLREFDFLLESRWCSLTSQPDISWCIGWCRTLNRVIVRCRPHGFTAPYSLIELTAKPLASYLSRVVGSSRMSTRPGAGAADLVRRGLLKSPQKLGKHCLYSRCTVRKCWFSWWPWWYWYFCQS